MRPPTPRDCNGLRTQKLRTWGDDAHIVGGGVCVAGWRIERAQLAYAELGLTENGFCLLRGQKAGYEGNWTCEPSGAVL